jgi:hypothetical protein
MASTEIHLTEKKLNPFTDFSLHNQSFWLFFLVPILFFKPKHYKNSVLCLALSSLILLKLNTKQYFYFNYGF